MTSELLWYVGNTHETPIDAATYYFDAFIVFESGPYFGDLTMEIYNLDEACWAPAVGASQVIDVDLSAVDALASSIDGTQEFREGMEQLRIDLRRSGQWLQSARVARVLRDEIAFVKCYNHATTCAATAFVTSQASGDFMKWFLEWFQNGGWEVILAFIKALMGLFG